MERGKRERGGRGEGEGRGKKGKGKGKKKRQIVRVIMVRRMSKLETIQGVSRV